MKDPLNWALYFLGLVAVFIIVASLLPTAKSSSDDLADSLGNDTSVGKVFLSKEAGGQGTVWTIVGIVLLVTIIAGLFYMAKHKRGK